MINTQLFRRHYAVTVSVIFVFFLIGFLVSNLLMKLLLSHTTAIMNSEPDIFLAHLIDDFHLSDRTTAIRHLEELSGGTFPFRLSILNSEGEDLSGHKPLPFHWEKIQKPKSDYEVTPTDNHFDSGPPGFFGKIIKLPGAPTEYLFVTPDFQHGPPGPPHPPLSLILITFGSILTFVLIGIGIALYLIFRSIRQKITLADNVISELQNGNLKARIPIGRMDELGLAMTRFNKMAEEIEHLVEQLRNVEKARIVLLQDLTHDLRTPIASLKNLLVTIEKKNTEEDQSSIRAELLSIAQKEVDYFERLVEDLLVLAQISEPKYQAGQELISITELIDEESQSLSNKSSLLKKSIEIIHLQVAFVSGDRHLLRRLFKNALENALSFAKTQVKVSVELINGHSIRVLIQDDGPGFTEAALSGFGERKVSRVMVPAKGSRLSVGLGSVIMKTVTVIHSGHLIVRNRTNASGEIMGAELEIILPRRNI